MAIKPKAAKNAAYKKNHTISASSNGRPGTKAPAVRLNQYGIPDWRLEQPEFEVFEVSNGPEVHYKIKGKLNAPVPPIRESKYMTKEQQLELYPWMLMNLRIDQPLVHLSNPPTVLAAVYFL